MHRCRESDRGDIRTDGTDAERVTGEIYTQMVQTVTREIHTHGTEKTTREIYS